VGVALVLAASTVVSTACGERIGGSAAPLRQDIVLTSMTRAIDGRVPRDATFETLFRGHALPPAVSAPVVGAIGAVFNPRGLRADQPYRIHQATDGALREFQYQIDADRLLRVEATGESPATFRAEVVALPKSFERAAVAVEITRDRPSLIGALDAAGESVELALTLATVFGGEVDFNSDLQPGDRLEVYFERATRDGESAGYGQIWAAVLENAGRAITAVRFVGADGKPGWYDEAGRSLRRQFLKSPLPFDGRVTSRFSYRRLHPVSGKGRPHLGVDYGAPVGTPVRAVAAGVVQFAGWSGEAGRMVRLRHGGGYETAYLHLSAFGPGIRPGVRVQQEQLIGRVGATGAVTGPHLDYRIIKNGRYVNPLTELRNMPKGEPIAAAERAAFDQSRDQALTGLRDTLTSSDRARR
jgi:murein DD-endopeptidase MepM/ murein hydrolase activator NlpD